MRKKGWENVGKTLIKVDCVDQRLVTSSNPIIASGGRNEDEIKFSFSSLWDGFEKSAVFYRSEDEVYRAVISDNRCVIPHEVLRNEGVMYFGVFGVKDDTIRTSEIMKYYISKGAITEGTNPSDPTPDIYTQYVGRIVSLEKFTINGESYSASGEIVQLENYEGMPMDCVTTIDPKQTGSGEPSPDNVRPISGRTSAKLTRCGKNLLEYTSMTVVTTTINGVTYTVNSDGSITANGTATSTSILMLASSDSNPKLRNALLGNQITMSGCPSGGGTNKYVIRLFQHAGENSRVDDAGSGVTTTFVNADLPFNVAIIVWSGVTVSNLVFRPMIRFAADTDASHKPYTGDTFAASFGQTIYGGVLDWATGVLTIDRAMKAFTGSEYCEKSSTTTSDRFISPIKDALSASDVICSHGNGGGDLNDLNHCYITASSNFAWNYSAHGSTTVDEFKAYLAAQNTAGTPVQVVYKLATPTTIQLTPNEIRALSGANNIWCDAGKTAVSGRKDILWLTSYLIQRLNAHESAIISLGGNV